MKIENGFVNFIGGATMFYLIGLGKVFFTVCGVILVTAALTTFGWEATIVGAAQTIISVTGLIILTVIVV
ncbi:hypothetical protein KAR91_46165, partial [Candidatus Pacearchaeota archaeon]|nr:hypothetical protein [Candidatus Pacearchaeota archaeon]